LTKLTLKVSKVKGNCPVYKEGDTFFIFNGYRLETKITLCMHSLASIMPYYVALSKGINPKELGLSKDDNVSYLQCLYPCEYTGGGTVIFEIKKEEI